MWETVNGDEGMTPDAVVREIIRVNRLALEFERSPLANVVINCHGADNGGGALYTGGLDYPSARINLSRVNEFSLLKKRNIGTIWLVACQAAARGLGKQLCQALAVACGSQVVAGDEDQDTGIWRLPDHPGWRPRPDRRIRGHGLFLPAQRDDARNRPA